MKTSGSCTVLIVDDNPEDTAEVRRLLAKHPNSYRFLDAQTGAEGLEHCRTEQPDCVLLDYYLPDMNGAEFLDALRSESGTRLPIPIALLSGVEDEELGARILSSGAQDYLITGTLTGPGLVRAIENAIERYQIVTELEEKRAALELRTFELSTVRDELQNRLAEVADAAQAKDQFLAVMSHEMRTPLNAIFGYADLLGMGIGDERAREEYIERIRVGGQHLLNLINDVLDLARTEARQLQLDSRPVDLHAALEEIVALLDGQARAAGIRLVLESRAADASYADADLQRLRQILTNLIGNAIKFTEQGSVTVVGDPADDGEIRVRVIDTGIGIAPESLPLIFSEFYQVQGDLTRERGGSGLGLAISQRLARLMGGDIAVESELGQGSTFTLVLRAAECGSTPRPDDATQRNRRARSRAAAETGEAATTVVAFGDDPEALAALEQSVHPRVRLLWTTDADEVPVLARSEGARLVVLDVASADGAAWRAAHALQDAPELASTAVLLLPKVTGAAADEEVGGIDLGWVSLVPKPFTAEQLTHAVSSAARTVDPGGERSADAEFHEVLIVDDDPDSRRVAAQFLEAAGASTREAPDGESALVAMRRREPDVVVLDLMMPVLDGFGVLATMGADPRLARIPVVVLSAKSLTEAEREFLARTAVRVLQKGEHRLTDVAALVLRAAEGPTRARSDA